MESVRHHAGFGKWALFLILWCALGLILPCCGNEEPALKVNIDNRQNVYLEPEEDIITYAVLPQYSHTVSYERHHLLVEYLRAATGLNIKQIFPDTFDEHLRMVGQGKIDISYSNPFIYVKMAQRFGAQAFARAVEHYGGKDFRGQIICRADNEQIRTLQDCKGKTWIATDPGSAGGYFYPLGHFVENGIKKEDFARIDFAPGPGGKQEKVVLAVYAGKYDIGSVREGTLNVVANKIDIGQIRVIANSRWYPGWMYAARKGLQPEVVGKIRDALCRLNYNDSADKAILEAADLTGIIPAADQDFDPVRQLAAILNMDLNVDLAQ